MLKILSNKNIFISTTTTKKDVISIEKTNEFFRLIYDVKGRLAVHRITKEEAKVRGQQKETLILRRNLVF
jgi:small subunit ribosomal protein S4e